MDKAPAGTMAAAVEEFSERWRALRKTFTDNGRVGRTLWFLFTMLTILVFAGCPQPLPPVPPGPTPVADAAPLPDRFAGGIYDCTALDTSPWQPYAATCGDTSDVRGCMNDYASTMADPAPLICAARDVQVAGFLEIAKGTAGPELTARARALRAWLLATGATLRGAP